MLCVAELANSENRNQSNSNSSERPLSNSNSLEVSLAIAIVPKMVNSNSTDSAVKMSLVQGVLVLNIHFYSI